MSEPTNVIELPESPLAFFKNSKPASAAAVVEEKKPEVAETAKPTEVVKAPEVVPAVVTPPEKKENTPELNFAALRKEKESLAAQLEELRKNHESVSSEIEKFRLRPEREAFEALQKEKEQIHKELKTAMVWRDPEFRKKYDDQIEVNLRQMLSIAEQSGVERGRALSAIQGGNVAEIEQWLPDMPELLKRQFGRAFENAEELKKARNAEIENGEKTWEERQKFQATEREQAQRRAQESYKSAIETAYTEVAQTLPEDETLRTAVRNMMQRAVPLQQDHMSAAEVLKHVGASAALSHICTAQQAELETLRAKVAEQEAFIKKEAGATPPVGGGNGQQAEKKWTNPISMIAVKVPR